jgi:PadR family transcriptional regulator PadR
MVLQTLESLGPLHGYAIAGRFVAGNWGTTDTNRKARFYKLTPAGRRELGKEKDAWNRMAGIMHTLLHGEG